MNRIIPRAFRRLAGIACLAIAFTGATPAAACAIAAPGATERVTIGDTGRSALIHLPDGFAPSRPAPLVLLFHGSTGNGAEVLRNSRLAETADRHGFIVVAPDGGIRASKGFVWNIPGVPATNGRMPSPDDADDVIFVKATIDWLVAQRCVDSRRVYASGISGGGRMSSWLACVAADRFAAIAPVVGLRAGNPSADDPERPDPATCRPARPVPVIAFAGDADRTNPIQGGGAPYWRYPMRAAEARWAELNGCREMLPIRHLTPDLYEEGYARCSDRAAVIARITIGGRHQWLADNEALWNFFSHHHR